MREPHSNMRESRFCSTDGQTVAQVARSGCRVSSVLSNPAVADPTWAGLGDLQPKPLRSCEAINLKFPYLSPCLLKLNFLFSKLPHADHTQVFIQA